MEDGDNTTSPLLSLALALAFSSTSTRLLAAASATAANGDAGRGFRPKLLFRGVRRVFIPVAYGFATGFGASRFRTSFEDCASLEGRVWPEGMTIFEDVSPIKGAASFDCTPSEECAASLEASTSLEGIASQGRVADGMVASEAAAPGRGVRRSEQRYRLELSISAAVMPFCCQEETR